MRRLLAGALLALCWCCLAPAQPKSDWESAEEERNWKEVEANIPPYPKDQDLLEFFVSSATTLRFYLDPASISIGADGVVRYALVARSASGVNNVSFEGLRCKTGENRTYAFGQKGGTWSIRPTEWKKVQVKSVMRWHDVLRREYLCDGGSTAPSAEAIVQGLRSGRGLNPLPPR